MVTLNTMKLPSGNQTWLENLDQNGGLGCGKSWNELVDFQSPRLIHRG